MTASVPAEAPQIPKVSPVSPPPTPAATSPKPSSLNFKKVILFLFFFVFVAGTAAAAYHFRLFPFLAPLAPPQIYQVDPVSLGEYTTKFEYNRSWEEGGKEVDKIYNYDLFPSTANGHKILRFRAYLGSIRGCPKSDLENDLPSNYKAYAQTLYDLIRFGWAQYGPGVFRPRDCFDGDQECGPFNALLDRDGSPAHFSLLKSSCPYEINITQLFQRFGYDSGNRNSGTIMVKTFIHDAGDTRKSDNLTVHIINYSPPTPSPSPSPRPSPSPSPSPRPSPSPSPRPSPSPSPSPRPSPSPSPSLSCTNLGPQPSAPKPGDRLTFTCRASAQNTVIHHYNFRVNQGTPVRVTTSAGTANFSYTVPAGGGTFKVQCQVCTGPADSSCTSWGQAR